MIFERYVAIGDSSTEGIDDPDGCGGYRGWSRRLAERIAAVQGSLLYANFAVRGRRTRQILDEQLAPALALRPDLATVFAGSNDILRPGFDPRPVRDDVAHMQGALVSGGATVLTFTLPDLGTVMPFGRVLRGRVQAMNDALRQASRDSGTILVDFAAAGIGSDPRFWSDDRFHANSAGHGRIAAALAQALELPGSDEMWRTPLEPAAPTNVASRAAFGIRWTCRYVIGGALMALSGRSVRRVAAQGTLTELTGIVSGDSPNSDG